MPLETSSFGLAVEGVRVILDQAMPCEVSADALREPWDFLTELFMNCESNSSASGFSESSVVHWVVTPLLLPLENIVL